MELILATRADGMDMNVDLLQKFKLHRVRPLSGRPPYL